MPNKGYSETWFAIDANNLLFPDVCMGDKSAKNFAARLQTLNRQWEPERTIVAFDSSESFRRKLFPEYKAKRGAKPEGIDDALKAAKEACWDECVDCVAVPEFEADDVLATIAAAATATGRRCVLFSSDKDMRQLLRAGKVTQCRKLNRDRDRFTAEWMTADDVKRNFDVTAEQWVEFQMLVGDASDNYPGVDGIGPKTAKSLLAKYGTLGNLFAKEEREQIRPREVKKLFAARENGTLDLMRKIATLRDDVPISEALLEMEATR
ncbi:5'-3' exonuclease [Allorhodopirellula heiligendammensis]|uniref:DNA polymerase I, thermostable n=1 Tax=Allorhodopirellula heiligendammensis TaxID=2714739 RepID=A0A5C6C890_9BACT|nr:5'-3' exonuclease H3TH domain-containing protein [Allorhodopirellula heiligendammensis]TWU19534.1 DNA polymerase I, thermostable [Allorhodopirellula heiligendammensis]